MSFRREPLVRAGGFDPYFRYHQDETDACLGILALGYDIVYIEGAAVNHEWCEGSYRSDMLKWYIRLRYLWGRNNSYLVKKHFDEVMTFPRYVGNRMNAFIVRRTVATKSPGEKMRANGRNIPVFITAMGAFSEAMGLVRGWRDGSSIHRDRPT
jgi:GT2 family glycosyltransferase